MQRLDATSFFVEVVHLRLKSIRESLDNNRSATLKSEGATKSVGQSGLAAWASHATKYLQAALGL